jgi:hypothetical protein
MTLLEEIRQAFANLEPGQQAGLSTLPQEHTGRVYRTSSALGVAVPVARGTAVSESFAGATLQSRLGTVGEANDWLCFESTHARLRNEFAAVCAQFLHPGTDGSARRLLVGEPCEWWKRWRQLLGNSSALRPSYSVLGELLVLERLVSVGASPSWGGPDASSHDIRTASGSFEVKSTVMRYGSVVHIAGQYQLLRPAGEVLFLVHQRFEAGPNGDSVDEAALRLKARGFDFGELEMSLTKAGLEMGCSARKERYALLDSQRYIVDDSFPSITPASFVGGSLPKGVTSLSYEVDLDTLVGEPFCRVGGP